MAESSSGYAVSDAENNKNRDSNFMGYNFCLVMLS